MTDRTTHANADQMLDSLLSRLDADSLSKAQLSDEELIGEIAAVIDHLDFPHWTTEQKLEAKSRAIEYLQSIDREDLVSNVKSYPTPAGKRLLAAVFFCLFGLLAIVAAPLRWCLDLTEWLFCFCCKTEPKQTRKAYLAKLKRAGYREVEVPYWEFITDASNSLVLQVWPTKGNCLCCKSFEHVNAE